MEEGASSGGATDDPPVDSLLDRARQLVADGAGRPTLRKELQISDYRAKVLLAQLQDEEAS